MDQGSAFQVLFDLGNAGPGSRVTMSFSCPVRTRSMQEELSLRAGNLISMAQRTAERLGACQFRTSNRS